MSEPAAIPEGYCTLCSIPIPSFAGLSRCPNCGTSGTPCRTADDVPLTLNRHELAILCHWAERWGMYTAQQKPPTGGPGTVYAIVERLKRRTPALAADALTLADGMAALRADGINFWTNIPGIENPPTPPEAPDARA